MTYISEPEREIVVEPIRETKPAKEPAEAPEPAPVPEPDPVEPVPA